MRIGEALVAGSLAVLAGSAPAPNLPETTDPVFAEAYSACLAAIVGHGFVDQSYGWTTKDSGDVDAMAWQNWTHGFAIKDVAGVGVMSLSARVEDYPGYDVGSCSVTISDPQRQIVAPELVEAGFEGTIQGDAADWSGAWRNEAATLFIRGLMSTEGGKFGLYVTSVGRRS